MITELFLLFFVIITLSWFPYYAWRNNDIKSIQGPFALPFIGTLKNLAGVPTEVFKLLKEHMDVYGKTFRGYILAEQTLFTIDKDFIEFVSSCNTTINKARAYGYLHNWLGTGLLTSSGKKWHMRRKLITPAYHFKVLDQFMEIFDRNSSILVRKLRKEVCKDQIDIFPFVNLCALDTICETSLGTKVNAQISDESDFVKSTKLMNSIFINRAFSLLKNFDVTYELTRDYNAEQEALKVLHGYTLSVIKSRREQLHQALQRRSEEIDRKDDFLVETREKDSFLDLLLKSTINGQPLSDEDIREEVDTFTFEGHDTVSSGLSFTLYTISNHPEVQARLWEEQRSIYGNDLGRPTTLNDLSEMKYLDMVIKESLRLYPPVPIFARTVSENTKYKDLFLRKGVQIAVFVYELHRDPDNFPDPLKFDPDRFLPENQLRRHPFSYIPFSAGHRNCIGQKFAMLEMKSTLAKVLRNFELLPAVPKIEPQILPEIILRSENGVMLRLQERNSK